jgi:predicted DNA-binding transcriptional regulator YafY
MTPARARLAAASRDPYQGLRRVERQQWVVERLHAARERVTVARLAEELGVSRRTVARDLARLRESGVPARTTVGRDGGASLDRTRAEVVVALDVPELAALLASLAAVAPTVSDSAASAMRKLSAAFDDG